MRSTGVGLFLRQAVLLSCLSPRQLEHHDQNFLFSTRLDRYPRRRSFPVACCPVQSLNFKYCAMQCHETTKELKSDIVALPGLWLFGTGLVKRKRVSSSMCSALGLE